MLVDRSAEPERYRLDESILRQEIIGIALQLKGVSLPAEYGCKGYYTDVQPDESNSWVCRAVELAADNGMISRENKRFRPMDRVTE